LNYKEHSIGGIIISIMIFLSLLIYTRNITTALSCSGVSYIMALYPDMDISSISKRIITIGTLIIIGYLVYIGGIYQQSILILSGLIIIPNIFKHRGVVHTLKFGVLVSYLIYIVLSNYIDIYYGYVVGAGVVGYMTHLMLDDHIRI